MNHSPADICRRLLIGLGQLTDPLPWETGVGLAWPGFVSAEPNVPDNCVTLKDTQGSDDGRVMTDGEPQDHFGFQVRVRGTDHAAAWAKADAIRTALAMSVDNRTVSIDASTYTVHAIARIGQAINLGKDTPTSRRSLFTINAVVAITAH